VGPLAIVLAKDHTVTVPDLRGMGMSDHPDTGYTKKNKAVDIAGVMDALKVQKADLVTHDIGNMVGDALAAQYPVRVMRWVVIGFRQSDPRAQSSSLDRALAEASAGCSWDPGVKREEPTAPRRHNFSGPHSPVAK
jgi:pimeloyl-ACP methyl ester carboxylesterase